MQLNMTPTAIERIKSLIFTGHDQLKYWLKGLGLSIGLLFNEVMIRGNAKMEKLRRWSIVMSTPKIEVSLAKANLPLKDSSHVNI